MIKKINAHLSIGALRVSYGNDQHASSFRTIYDHGPQLLSKVGTVAIAVVEAVRRLNGEVARCTAYPGTVS
jgi:hypothetical protein